MNQNEHGLHTEAENKRTAADVFTADYFTGGSECSFKHQADEGNEFRVHLKTRA